MQSADPILMIPGLNCTAALYATQTARLASSATVDIADHRQDDSVAAIAARVLAAAPPRFALVGLSMGGYVAFEILRQAPDRVTKLALLDTTARPDTEDASERRRRLIALAEKGGFAEIPGLQVPMLLGRRAAADPAAVGLVHSMAHETGAAAFVRQQRAIIGRPDSRPLLAEIRCPVLVVVGAEDQITPPELAAEMAEAIPNARRVVVEGSGHLSTIEAPDEIADLLQAFLVN